MKTSSAFRYTLLVIIALILIALGFWYFFIQARQEKIAKEDAGRGLGSEPPSFGSTVGNTYENIVSSLSTPVGGKSERSDGALPRLAQVGKTPTAGLGFIGNALSTQKSSSTSTMLRFMERSTGYIFDVDLKTGVVERLTNTLIPYVYEAIASKRGIIVRSVSETGAIITAVGTISASSTSDVKERTLIQNPLPSGIRAIFRSLAGDDLLYIKREKGEAVGFRAAWDGTKPQKLFSSNVSDWQMHLASNGRVIIVQRSSDGIAGSAYIVGNGDTLIPLIRNVPGLTLLPHPSSSAFLYGSSSGGLALFAQVDEKSTSVALPIKTIADKCVWSRNEKTIAYCAVPEGKPSVNFLDRWHRGEEHTSDAWWRVDAKDASAEILSPPGNVPFDVENPIIDDGGNYIAFTNARDKALWLLRIKE
ncbi:MAG: hypothetical protein AAB947_00585 [Patescibacteria group bacterium]